MGLEVGSIRRIQGFGYGVLEFLRAGTTLDIFQVNRSKYSLPSDGHVVLPDSGQPGLDSLDFDDLYNNLKVYEHELKGVSNSNSQNIAFLSAEVKGSTLKQNLLQIDEDAMEEIDIRWQVAMITARIRKFMRKTGRSIDLKPKNGITFDKSKIECFNCQKLDSKLKSLGGNRQH
ncbi:hypothetical protein Tco_1226639 [Tanacetum coccineum]